MADDDNEGKGSKRDGDGDEPQKPTMRQVGETDISPMKAPEESARSPDAPLDLADTDTKDFLKDLERKQKERLEQKLAEAREMERRAKNLVKKVQEQQKFRRDYEAHSAYVEQLAPELGLDPTRPVTEIPDLEGTDLTQVEFTTMVEGRSYVRLVYDETRNRHLYQVIEPDLTSSEEEVLEFLRDTLVRTLDGRHDPDEDWEQYLVDAIERAIVDHSILVDEVSKERLEYYLIRDFLGYGPIDVMMKDPMIEDISCDGPGIPIYVFHRHHESIKSNVVFEDERTLDSFVIRLAQRSGKHISLAEPVLDATLPDTSRLQATLSKEVTPRGSSFTIRRFRADPLTPPDLMRLGTLNAPMAALMWFAMEHGSSMIFAGGTASGKTTTLNSVSQFIPPAKKVVSIEDTREINLQHENWIAGVTREGLEGTQGQATKVDMFRLLTAALRQRPEYLLVGEVRGAEAFTLFQAMATGHATYSTLHADSVQSAVYRLENEPINIPRLMLQTLDAVAVQVQVRVRGQMVRRISEFVEIVDIDPDSGDLLTNTVFKWDQGSDTYKYMGKSVILEQIMDKINVSAHEIEEEWNDRTLVLEWMMEKGIRHITDVANVLSSYYSNPDDLMAKVRSSMGHETKEGTARGA